MAQPVLSRGHSVSRPRPGLYRKSPTAARMESDAPKIAVRSRKQAMDWGLVLASQGIEAIISRSDAGWELIVEAREYQRARETLEQYRIENRGWKWKYPLAGSELVFHWGSLAWVVVIAAADYWSTVILPAAGSA